MRASRVAVAALAVLLGTVLCAGAEVRSGVLSHASQDAIEINGERYLLTPESMLFCNGREISVGSLHRGMFAQAEIDDAGRLLQLDVNGVVE